MEEEARRERVWVSGEPSARSAMFLPGDGGRREAWRMTGLLCGGDEVDWMASCSKRERRLLTAGDGVVSMRGVPL